jgi:hypothetical protein
VPAGSISTRIILQHNQHQHFVGTYTGYNPVFTPLVTHDADSYYIVEVTAVDADGVSSTITRRLDPKLVRLELAVDPAVPADLFYDGASHAAPFIKQATAGFETTVVAPDTVKDSNGETLVFSGWSDGGAPTHQMKVLGADTTLVAHYVRDNTPPETTITCCPETATSNRQPKFVFESSEGPWYFSCQMDKGAWFACSSPYTVPAPLSYSTHTFRAQAYDRAGNADPTPAARQFAVVP